MGYTICYSNASLFHYCYPFYDYEKFNNNYGMGMMLKAIIYARCAENANVYLGSVTRSTDIYKLQFEGLEWFDGKQWKTDLEELKELIKE